LAGFRVLRGFVLIGLVLEEHLEGWEDWWMERGREREGGAEGIVLID
jgi:hypothetical protein